MWGSEAEVVFAQHHWPTWGNAKVVELLEKQRDLYRFINDETLRLANQGYTMREIAEQIELPESLATFWANRGYYGSLYHDVAATYVLYLGWFDGNPATLNQLPPAEASKNYVAFMGGADAVLAKARESYAKGEYRWVAEVVNHVVFAEPDNQDARNLQADALEQLGYQAESGPWRNFYLTGAKELREGVTQLPTPNTASPDIVRSMTPEMFFDYLGVRLNGPKAAETEAVINVDLRSEEHTSELQSIMRTSYAVFCLKKKQTQHKYSRTELCKKENKNDKTNETEYHTITIKKIVISKKTIKIMMLLITTIR